ncbi:MAG: alanine/ornithine racemase family PLP-dependent enzyme [Spirochaetaceae bacterium]
MTDGLTTPRIDIDLKKIIHNAKVLKKLYKSKDIDILGVTKMVCGDPIIANALLESEINILADSRISNIRKMRNGGVKAQFLLLRTPLPSQINDVVKYSDISLNSEISVLESLSRSALLHNVIHKVILMVELGDLREGIMPDDLEFAVESTLEMAGIELIGLGANLACHGGIRPDDNNMNKLSDMVLNIENKFGLSLQVVSGGNSANYNWFINTNEVGTINNLRLGESIYLGLETLDRQNIPGLFYDAFTLVAEVIELKTKPSLPYGEVGQDAFGNIPKFEDHGDMKRAILGVGLQDIKVSGITPKTDIDIIGMSSDHIIINTKNTDIQMGQEVEFGFDYGSLLSAMTSPYVIKNYINK